MPTAPASHEKPVPALGRRLAVGLAWLVAAVLFQIPARSAEDDWRLLLAARFDKVDAFDAEDGYLAPFVRGIRNDGRFLPPLRSLAGPELRNPTLVGLIDEAWLECAVLAPVKPGPLRRVWAFPVDNRDDFMAQMAAYGLSEFDGMDGVSILRETDAAGGQAELYIEWLPGEVALFSENHEALRAGGRIYGANASLRGLLASPRRSPADPDLSLALQPASLAAWQDRETGQYWWRDSLDLLVRDLVEHWRPGSAREQLLRALGGELAALPLSLDRLTLRAWLEETGIEWRLDVSGDFAARGARTGLEGLRRLPGDSALAYAMPLGRERFGELGGRAGRFLLAAAGGAAAAAARESAQALFSILLGAGPRQMATALVPPPSGAPELGASRLLAVEWEAPEKLADAWSILLQANDPASPLSRVLNQMGLSLGVESLGEEPGTAAVSLRPGGDAASAPYAGILAAVSRYDSWLAVAYGSDRDDPEERLPVIRHRIRLAREAAREGGPGQPEIREILTKMGRGGADWLGFADPVRFLQAAFAEGADWRRRLADQNESRATRLAREMYEHRSGGAWVATGDYGDRLLTVNGSLPWNSLLRLAGALGVTEAMGLE